MKGAEEREGGRERWEGFFHSDSVVKEISQRINVQQLKKERVIELSRGSQNEYCILKNQYA